MTVFQAQEGELTHLANMSLNCYGHTVDRQGKKLEREKGQRKVQLKHLLKADRNNT